MNFDSKLLTNDDLDFCKEKVKKYGYLEKFPHPTWANNDALMKWTFIANYFEELNEKEKTIIDFGSCGTPLPHIVSSIGHNVIGIDISDIRHSFSGSLVKMILNDALIELKEMEDNCVDYFMDSCAVTHFNRTYTNQVSNQGWKDISEQVHRTLKPNGKFIIVTDVDIKNEFGEFIKPELIVELVQSSGLKLVGKPDYFQSNPHTLYVGEYVLQTAKFIFEK